MCAAALAVSKRFAVVFLGLLAAAPGWTAGAYPEQPVKLVVPFPAGGSADILGRLIGQKLSERLKQQIVIENRPGAGGNIGTEIVARAKPDGYTLLMGTVSTHGINPNLYAQLPYDAVKSFEPIVLVARMPNVLVVNPSVAANSVQELIALARAKPGQITFASAGNGTSQHLSGELFKKMAGVELLHIPYKGNAPAVSDLLGGQVNMMFDNVAVSLTQVRAGKLRALAVTSAKRSPALPRVPTVAESGLPGYEILSWFGLFAPAGTPKEIVARINAEVVGVLDDKSVRERLGRDGIEPGGGTPATFATFVQAELPRWAKLVRESGARID